MENDDELIRSFQASSPTTPTGLVVTNPSYNTLLYPDSSSQSSTGSQQDFSDSDHRSSQYVSAGLPPPLEHKRQHPAELNRPSHSNSIYADHGSCNADCKKHMYTAVMHYSQKDRAFADKIQSVLENITLLFHHKEYHARVASLFPLTGNQPLEALHEIQQFEMTTNIIFICTENYENDEKAKCTGRRIIDAAVGTSLRVTQLICDSSTTAETGCASIFYNPESQSFVKDMATILLGKAFRELLIHDKCRQQCETNYSKKVSLRHSKYFVSAKLESPKPSFHRTNSLPSNAAHPGKRDIDNCKSSFSDQRSEHPTSSSPGHQDDNNSTDGKSWTQPEPGRAPLVTRKHSFLQSAHETFRKTSLLRPEHKNIGPPDMRQPTDECENVSERAIPSGSDHHTIERENEESSESWVSSTSNDQKTYIGQFNSMSTSSSEAHDDPRHPSQQSKRPIDHFNKPPRSNRPQGNVNNTNKLESTSSSQELQSGCSRHEIKRSLMPATSDFSKNAGTESNGLPVAVVCPMSSFFADEYEDDHQTLQKTSLAAEQHQTEVSALHQQQDTGSRQNPASQNQHTATTVQSTSSHQHSSSQQARQQTADVQQSPTDQQHGINSTGYTLREEIAEVPGWQRSTQDLNSQKNLSTSLTSFPEARDNLLSRLLRRFTSMVTCDSRRKRRKSSGAKEKKKKPP